MMRTSTFILSIVVAAMLLGCGLFDDGHGAAESEGGAQSVVAKVSPPAATPTSAANDEEKPPAVSATSPPVTAPALPESGGEEPPVVSAVSPPVAPPTSTASDEPVATGALAVAGARPVSYDGPSSLEERILASPVIARVRLDSTTSTIERGSTYLGMKRSVLLEFNFSVLEYLKGSGANDIVAVWASAPLFDTRQEAQAALPALVAARDAGWDDRDAIVFLQLSEETLASTQQADRFYLAWGGSWVIPDDGYSIASIHNKLWLPAEAAVGAPSQPSGDQQRFLMDAPPATGTAPTITLGEMKNRIAAVTAKLDASDGSEEYMECVQLTYQYEREERHYRAMYPSRSGSTSANDPPHIHEFDSGLAAGGLLYEDTGYGGIPDKKWTEWFDGGDADLFSIEHGDAIPYDFFRDGVNDSIQYARRVVASRPLPEGAYRFHFNSRSHFFGLCDGYTTRYEWTVTVSAPVGSLHEFFFDPVADGAAVAADDSNGTLEPAAFTDANDASATVRRIAWESGSVKLEVSPHTGLADRVVDFIETDGSVSLSLDVADAAVDAANETLSWPVPSQPWHDGDTLMVRIREHYVPAPSNLRVSQAGHGYLAAWDAVPGAGHYALQTRIPGVLDEWEDRTPFAEETRQWHVPAEDLWCAASYEFRVRAYGDGIRYAAEWGEPSSVVARAGDCNNAPEFDHATYEFDVSEDAAVGEPVGTVSADDLDALTYSITAGDSDGKFAIGETSGAISVAGELDHATTASYTLTVGASDGRGGTDSATVQISVVSAIVDYDTDDDGLIEVSGLAQLDAIRWDLDGDGASTNAAHAAAFPRASAGMGCPSTGCDGYELSADLDFDTDGSGSADSADDYWNDGSGWDPIGDSSNGFRAVFEGNGHALSNLFIARPSTDRVGLFAGAAALSVIRNVRLVSVDVTGADAVGALVGRNDDGTVSAVCASGSVSGDDYVGGLVGRNDGSVVNGCSSSGVSGGDYVGGLVGLNFEIVSASYATGSVTGDSAVGGLVGRNDGSVTNGYATGGVTASGQAGGLVGDNRGRVVSAYATGGVSGSSAVGGLVGASSGGASVSGGYWDTGTGGLSVSAGGEGKTTAELRSPTSESASTPAGTIRPGTSGRRRSTPR